MKEPYGADCELSVGEEAARWLCDLEDGSDELQAAFFAWLRRSPRHVEEFLLATAVWKKLHQFGHGDPARIERLIAAAQTLQQAGSNVVALTSRPTTASPSHVTQAQAGKGESLRRGRPGPWAVAAGVAMLAATAAVGWWAVPAIKGPPTYVTDIGEHRTLRLEDGSLMQLNTKSRAVVRYSKDARDIELLEGEALFTVKHDPARPFRVDAGSSVIQAVGTQFNVYRRKQDTTVSVIEGKVKVLRDLSADPGIISFPVLRGGRQESAAARAAVLAAGEEANIAVSGNIVKRTAPDVARAVAWRERQLVFRADRLEDVVAEVNRYSRRSISIEGEPARNWRVTAIFDANDPESLLRFLEKIDSLSVEDSGDAVLIRAR